MASIPLGTQALNYGTYSAKVCERITLTLSSFRKHIGKLDLNAMLSNGHCANDVIHNRHLRILCDVCFRYTIVNGHIIFSIVLYTSLSVLESKSFKTNQWLLYF